jgi:quinol monooxygenase YgiN
MVSLIARFRFGPEDRAEIAEAVRMLAAETRKEPGCVTYVPHYPEGDPDTVLIYEQYIDEKAMVAHRDSAHYKKWCVGGLYQKMKDRTVEMLTALA